MPNRAVHLLCRRRNLHPYLFYQSPATAADQPLLEQSKLNLFIFVPAMKLSRSPWTTLSQHWSGSQGQSPNCASRAATVATAADQPASWAQAPVPPSLVIRWSKHMATTTFVLSDDICSIKWSAYLGQRHVGIEPADQSNRHSSTSPTEAVATAACPPVVTQVCQ